MRDDCPTRVPLHRHIDCWGVHCGRGSPCDRRDARPLPGERPVGLHGSDMIFYDLVEALESRREDTIDLLTGSPLWFDGIARLLTAELTAPRWIDGKRLASYADYDGIPDFIELLAGRWSVALGRDLDPREIMVTPGAQGALTLILHWLGLRGRVPLYPLALEFPGAVTRNGRTVGCYRSVAHGA